MNMEKYMKPTIKVKEIEIESILAAESGKAPADEGLDNENEIQDANAIESKRYGNVSSWDD